MLKITCNSNEAACFLVLCESLNKCELDFVCFSGKSVVIIFMDLLFECRMSSVAYLASYLSRAKFIPSSLVASILKRLEVVIFLHECL